MSVYTKLNLARQKFHELKLTKTGENKFAGYKYFELGDFLIPALEVFREVGLCAYVSFDKEIATMTIVDLESDTRMEITSPMGSAALKGCHEVQNIGAVETYQRRYLWVAALEIVEHDALDATTGKDALANGGTLKHTPRGGIGDDLPPEDKEFLKELAEWCTKQIKAGETVSVAQHIATQKLEADQRVYLEDQMDSKTRSAIKRAETEIRATFNQREKAPA
jgi:hypothetical protein